MFLSLVNLLFALAMGVYLARVVVVVRGGHGIQGDSALTKNGGLGGAGDKYLLVCSTGV